jgi:CheY-like chemotaxis protein
MGATASRRDTDQLERIAQRLATSIGDALSDGGASVQARPLALRRWERSALLQRVDAPHAVLSATLGGELDGATLTVLLRGSDIATLGHLGRGSPAESIEEARQRGTLEAADLEYVAELGARMFPLLDTALRESADFPVGVTLRSHGSLAPGEDATDMLASGDVVALEVALKLDTCADSKGFLVLDAASAERLNGGPLALADGDDEIPQAPIIGRLAAFLADGSLLREVHRSCRRVGLELRRHGRREIPNPAAHRGDVVLIDVPVGEERRLDWCQRLKGYDPDIRVMVLLHHPSRSRVLRAFKSRADAIVGCPISEAALSPKLATLVASTDEPEPEPTEDADDGKL